MGAEPFLGKISMFGFNFAPRGWSTCDGQMMSIAQNTALFSLLGTQYGGDGRSTFALPDLRSRLPVHMGQGTGLSPYTIGQQGGTESVTLTVPQMPAHNHSFASTSTLSAIQTPSSTAQASNGSFLGRSIDDGGTATPRIYVPAGSTDPQVQLGGLNVAGTIGPQGSSQPHPNIQPYLAVNFSIALQGVFPSRN